MDFSPTPDQRQGLAQALYAGRKIHAIKQLRRWSGLELKEAKEFVERLEVELRVAHPERFTASSSNNAIGCFVVLVLLALAAVFAWFLIRR